MTADEVMALIRATDKPFYVYVLHRENGVPFYVGKGANERILHHAWEARKGRQAEKHRIIRKLWKSGEDIEYRIVSFHDDEREAYEIEATLVSVYGRRDTKSGSLANRANGGAGPSGFVITHELRQLRSENQKRRWQDPEFRAAQLKKLAARWADPEFKAQMVAHRRTEKARAAAADKQRQFAAQNVESTQASIAHARKHIDSKKAAAALWGNPEKRAAVIAAMQDPEFRAKRSVNMSRRWARQREIEARCVELMRVRGVSIPFPHRRAAIAVWQEFERSL